MWIESSVTVGDRPVGLNIERLDDDGREKTAAVLAWLTLEVLTGATPHAMSMWHDYAAEILRQHVSFVIADQADPEHLGSAWWSEAVGYALVEFVRHNELARSITRHLETMRGARVGVLPES